MGIVFDIKRFSIKDGPGIRTSVFLKGCPLRCIWCHNPESQKMTPEHCGSETAGREMSVEAVMREVSADRIFYRKSGGGMTLTGGEPMAQFKFTRDLLSAAKAEDIPAALDTCGYAPWEEFRELLPLVDLFLYDFKAADPHRHRELTGADNALIISNLRSLNDAGAAIYLRCPLVPGVNDDESHLAAIAEWAETLPAIREITIEPYHPLGVEKAARFGVHNSLNRKEFTPSKTVKLWKEYIASRTGKKIIVA